MGVMHQEVRFLADAMLGTLAKWLRILGYDTAYDANAVDHLLVRLARAEGRVLLTRDRQLVRRKGLDGVLIESDLLEEQLAQVLKSFGLGVVEPFSRCPVCNTPLEQVPKVEAWGQVPPYVFHTQEEFSLCPECDRFYWRGTHWRGMRQSIERLGC